MLPVDLTTLPVATSLHWLEAFGLWLHATPNQKRQRRSVLTLEAYLSDVRGLAAWFEAQYGLAFEPAQMNDVNVREYFASMRCAPATYNRRLASVRLLIQWARLEGRIDHDPSAWVPFVEAVRESPRDANDAERLALELAAEAGEGTLLGLRDSLMFFLMANAGLRISEVVELKREDLHLDDGCIHVFGKGKKHRTVRVAGRLLDKLRLWLDRMPASVRGTVITDEQGRPIGREQAWRRFVAIAERAGVRVTPHAMRHTFVLRYMDAVMAGDPARLPLAIDAVCQQTGDRPEVILAYYTRARESDIRAAAEVM